MKHLLFLIFIFISPQCFSAESIHIPEIGFSLEGESISDLSKSMQVFFILTALSILPALLIILTSFTRIIIVLSMLRHAIGLQTTPPNIVIINVALFLTFFTMMPVIKAIDTNALQPLIEEKISHVQAAKNAMEPLREFMIRQTREKDILLMIDLAKTEKPKKFSDIENHVLIPAFMLSELHTAFQIGFIIFLPFLLIDLVVASVLMSMGMIMVPPLTISLPVKLLMFVLIDGWALLVKALVNSFYI